MKAIIDPQTLIEVRCPSCRRRLCRVLGAVEIWCRKCKLWVIEVKKIDNRNDAAHSAT
jgi:ribosomal protein L37AE/L43A